MEKQKARKGKLVLLAEYYSFRAALSLARSLPLFVLRFSCRLLGNALYILLPRRRRLAMENLRFAFNGLKSEQEIRQIARESCVSFFLTAAEIMKFHLYDLGADAIRKRGYRTGQFEELFQKARMIHDQSGGCIFVTPHIGNWELLPYVSAHVGIPLAIVARPMDSHYLEKLITSNRTASGQIVVPKRNAMFVLQRILRRGKSIGMLPDQSTGKGIPADFFGRKAMTTPVPALLALTYRRPIVVVACCRSQDDGSFEGFVCDPIHPGEYNNEQTGILALTEAMNRDMESIIRRHPEQYLWMHNRWKEHKNRRSAFS